MLAESQGAYLYGCMQTQGSFKLLELSFDRLDSAWEKRYPFMRPPIQVLLISCLFLYKSPTACCWSCPLVAWEKRYSFMRSQTQVLLMLCLFTSDTDCSMLLELSVNCSYSACGGQGAASAGNSLSRCFHPRACPAHDRQLHAATAQSRCELWGMCRAARG